MKRNNNFEVGVGLTGCGCVIVAIALKLAFFGVLAYVGYHFIMKVW